MSDRTWNQIESRIYEEDWSKGARLIAAFLITRCPNQYGVFKVSWGFLKDFFKEWFTSNEIEGFCQELEADGCFKFYKGREILWIVKKWGRDRYSEHPNNRKGAVSYLVATFPDVVPDFFTWYGLSMDLVGLSTHKPGHSESDTDSEKKIMSGKPDGTTEKPKKEKKSITPLDLLDSPDPDKHLIGFFILEYEKKFGNQPAIPWDHAYPNIRAVLKRGYTPAQVEKKALVFFSMDYETASEYDQKWLRGHTWDMFIRHIDKIELKPQQKKIIFTEPPGATA